MCHSRKLDEQKYLEGTKLKIPSESSWQPFPVTDEALGHDHEAWLAPGTTRLQRLPWSRASPPGALGKSLNLGPSIPFL